MLDLDGEVIITAGIRLTTDMTIMDITARSDIIMDMAVVIIVDTIMGSMMGIPIIMDITITPTIRTHNIIMVIVQAEAEITPV